MYKTIAYSSVLNENINDSNLKGHTECRLGLWYSSDGKERFGNSVAFKMLDAPHKIVHDNVHQNLEYIKQSNVLQNKKQIVERFSQMEQASDSLFEILNDLLNETRK